MVVFPKFLFQLAFNQIEDRHFCMFEFVKGADDDWGFRMICDLLGMMKALLLLPNHRLTTEIRDELFVIRDTSAEVFFRPPT